MLLNNLAISIDFKNTTFISIILCNYLWCFLSTSVNLILL